MSEPSKYHDTAIVVHDEEGLPHLAFVPMDLVEQYWPSIARERKAEQDEFEQVATDILAGQRANALPVLSEIEASEHES